MSNNRLKEMFKDRKRVTVEANMGTEMDMLRTVADSMMNGQCYTCKTKYPGEWPPYEMQPIEDNWHQFLPASQVDMLEAGMPILNNQMMFFICCPHCVSQQFDLRIVMKTLIHKSPLDEGLEDGTLVVTVGGSHRDDMPAEMIEEIANRARERFPGRPVALRFSEDFCDTDPRSYRAKILCDFFAKLADRSMSDKRCFFCGDRQESGEWVAKQIMASSQTHDLLVCPDCMERCVGWDMDN